MEKRFLYFFFVMFLFLLVWSFLFPQQPQSPTVESKADSVSVQAPSDSDIDRSSGLPVTTPLLFDPADSIEAAPAISIGNFFITYSPTGGYIRSLSIESEANPLVYKNIGFSAAHADTVFSAATTDQAIIFTSASGERKEFIFDQYIVTVKVSSALRSPLIAFSSYKVEDPIDQRYQEVFFQYANKGIERRGFEKSFFGLFGQGVDKELHQGVVFAGARDRYYCAALLPGEHALYWDKQEYQGNEKKSGVRQVRLDLHLTTPLETYQMYIGPQSSKLLQDVDLQGVIYYGFFHSISMLMVKVLYFFFAITHSWGLSIILFSISIYLVLLPFTAKSMKAMKKMQQMQPDLEELKTKYKDNPQKLQKETIEFYRRHKINPVSGCLPLFFQMPVFLAMYQVIFRLFDLKGASFLWIKDLSLPDRIYELSFTIPLLNTQYINLLPILVMILGIAQQKITTSSASGAPSQQKTMGLVMTIFIGFVFYTFPSALVLYWFVQNIFTLLYQSRLASPAKPQAIVVN